MSETPRYRAVQPCFLQPVGYASPIRVEAGQEFEFEGEPGLAMLPLNAAARAARRRGLPDTWPKAAHRIATINASRGLGAPETASMAARRALIERFIAENPIRKEHP